MKWIFSFSSFRFKWSIVSRMLPNGSSGIIGEMAGAVSMFALDYVLESYSEDGYRKNDFCFPVR